MFRVRWEETALDELTQLWVQAVSALRRRITAASGEIDRQLSQDPFSTGESRTAGRRVMFVAPLGAMFRIEADGKTVSVLHVWLFRQHGSAAAP